MKPLNAKQCNHSQGSDTEVLGNEDFQQDRRIYLFQGIDEKVAQAIVFQLLVLNDDNPEEPIDLLINCPGGEADACEAILAAIHMIHAPVNTICMGQAFSAGFSILVCTTGLRLAYEYSTLMMHQPSGGFGGDITESKIQYQVMERLFENHVQRLHLHSGQPADLLRTQMERDYYMGAHEALERGFIDGIIRHDPRPRVVLHKHKHPTEDPDEGAGVGSNEDTGKTSPEKRGKNRGKSSPKENHGEDAGKHSPAESPGQDSGKPSPKDHGEDNNKTSPEVNQGQDTDKPSAGDKPKKTGCRRRKKDSTCDSTSCSPPAADS